ncbi:15462_t:CDS:2 [Cetraspora pellucida]|uniref:15462_t:CDS:1 n=1 Tax=Cetraspora pellucida TaxID=1433469 RepID=A0A9N9HMX5_9GLOM|nr:15462_t:CDS:2 [Cetraspora pellucida]
MCNYCKYQLSHKKGTETSHLYHHLKSCRKYQNLVFKKGLAELPKGQMQLEFSPTIKPSNNSIRKNLVNMIIRDELSFQFVEKQEFRILFNRLVPNFTISADTVKQDVIKAYDIKKLQTITLNNTSSNDVTIRELADHIFQNFYNLCEYESESPVIPSLDCDTHWNSTYKMLQLAIKMKNVIIRMKDHNKTFPDILDEEE